MWRSIWFWLALVIAVLCGAAAWAFRTTTEVEVSTAPVTDGQISRHILATGTVQAVTTVEVGAQVSGIIASLGADAAALAAVAAEHGDATYRADAAAAAALAAGGATAAAHLVRVNLGIRPADPRLARALASEQAAHDVATRLLEIQR